MRVARKYAFVLIAILIIASFATAQEACPAEVDDALIALQDVCLSVARNQACYGNGEIEALPVTGASIDFGQPGDFAPLDDIEALTLSPFEAGIEDWGIALLILQADLPDTLPGQNVTMLLFGDVTLTNESGAYYFTSGIGAPDCNQAPDGILIQTPEGVSEVNLTMNGIDISLGSTAYLATLDEDILTFALIEGHSTLSIEGSEIEIEGAEFTTIELDEEGNATGEFSEVQPIEMLELPSLPLVFLPESVELEATTSSAVPSELIFPLNGSWTTNLGEFTFSSACPPTFNDAMMRASLGQAGFGETIVVDIDFTDVADMEEFFRIPGLEAMDVEFTYSNPSTNVYMTELAPADGVSIVYTWTVLSDTYIEGTVYELLEFPGMGACEVNATFTFEHQG